MVARPTSMSGKVETLVYLIEVDRGTERGQRFDQEKIIQGQAYLRSAGFRERTKLRRGRWAFITTGATRRDNLKRRAEAISRSPSHYFSTFTDLNPDTFFSERVWHLMGSVKPTLLLPEAK